MVLSPNPLGHGPHLPPPPTTTLYIRRAPSQTLLAARAGITSAWKKGPIVTWPPRGQGPSVWAKIPPPWAQ